MMHGKRVSTRRVAGIGILLGPAIAGSACFSSSTSNPDAGAVTSLPTDAGDAGGFVVDAGDASPSADAGSPIEAGVFTEFPVPTSESGPGGITAGPDGNLWFTEFQASKVARITTAGVITE